MPLQHVRSSTANKRPVPGNMSDGQLGINTNTGSPGLFFKDSNNTLVKVGPVHVGPTAPNASPASGGTAGNSVGEQWLDTSGGTYVFKVWDGSAWRSESGTFVDVNGDVMTGALGIIAGSAGSPGLYFSGDTNTGLYSPGADQVAISTGGSGRLFVDASGNVGVGAATPDARFTIQDGTNNILRAKQVAFDNYINEGAGLTFGRTSDGVELMAIGVVDVNKLAIASRDGVLFATGGASFYSAANESARIDGSARLLVGTSSALTNVLIKGDLASSAATTPQEQFALATNTYNAGLSITNYSANDYGSVLSLNASNSNTLGANALVENTIAVGIISFNGNDGTNFVPCAEIKAAVDGTPGANDMPGRIVLSTTADGASSPTERLRVTSDGYVRLSTSSPGIQFNGDTALANALDDYEEGTFTPSIVGTSTAGTATYGSNGQQGRYTKIGNRVFFDLYLAWSAHTGTGDLQINGLPFTVQNTTNLNRTFSAIFSSLTLTAGSIGAAFSSPNTTTIALRQLPTGGGSVATVPMDTSAQISISGSFDV